MDAIAKLFQALFTTSAKNLDWDKLMMNPGLVHITDHIFSYLEIQDLANSRLISKVWKNYIDHTSKIWWVLQLQSLKNHTDILEIFPHYQPVFTHFESQAKQINLKDFCLFMRIYFQSGSKQLSEDGREYQRDPLEFAIHHGLLGAIQILLDSPLDFNIANAFGDTPFHLASAFGKENILCLLLDKIDQIDINKVRYAPSFFIAGEIGNANALTLFINHASKIDFQATDPLGHTILHLVAERGHVKLMELLIENAQKLRIDFNAKTVTGRTVLHSLVEVGMDIGPNLRDLHLPESFQMALEKRQAVMTSLEACQNRVKILRILLETKENTKIDFNGKDMLGMTVVHSACFAENLEMLKILKDSAGKKGIDMKARNAFGQTPLDMAKRLKQQDLIRVLEEAKKDERDFFGLDLD